MKLPEKVCVGGVTFNPLDVVTVMTENGVLITDHAAELEILLKIRNYNEASEGSQAWKEAILGLRRELKQVEEIIHPKHRETMERQHMSIDD